MTIDSSDIKILTAVELAGKASPDFLCSFFSHEYRENVIFCIESLVRRNLLRWEKDCLIATEEGLKHCSLPSLFGCLGKPPVSSCPNPVTGLTVCAMINLIISSKPCRPSMFPLINPERLKDLFSLVKDFVISAGAVFLSGDRYLPDLETVGKLSEMNNADLALSLVRMLYGQEAASATGSFIETLSECSTTESGMLSMLSFHLLRFSSQTPSEEIATLLQTLNTVIKRKNRFFVNPQVNRKTDNRTGKPECDTDLSIRLSLYTQMPPLLWLYSDIVRTDVVSEWILSKSGLFRALDAGVPVQTIKAELGYPYYDQILDMWQSSYDRIKVYDNCIVRCSDDLVPVMDNLNQLQEHIICRIACGVYYMKKSTSKEWHEILCNICHVDHLPLCTDEESKPETKIQLITGEEFKIHSTEEQENRETKDPRSLELTQEKLLDYFTLGSTVSAAGMDYGAKHSIIVRALKKKNTYLLVETLDEELCAKPLESIRTEDKGLLLKLLILPGRKEVLLPLSSFYRVTSLEAFSSHCSSSSSFSD